MRAAFAGMLAMAVIMGIGRFVYTPILPSMIGAGALDPAEAGLVAGANYLGYLLGALGATAGFFAPRRRLWFFIALASSVISTAAITIVDSVTAIAVIRFLAGVASAFSMIFIVTIVMGALAAAHRPGLIAMHFGGVGLGIAGSAILVSLLAAFGAPWPKMWLASGFVAAAGFVAVYWLLPATEAEIRPPRRAAGEATGSTLPLAIFIASYGFFGFGYIITATFINAMAKSEPALAGVEPYVWIVLGLAGLPSVWLWNRFAVRAGLTGAYALAGLVEAIGVALSVTVLSPAMLLVSAILLGGTFIAITSIGLARAREISSHMPNPAGGIAWMTASFGLGQMVGPVVAGWLFERTGNLVTASWLAVLALVIAAALAAMTSVISRRR